MWVSPYVYSVLYFLNKYFKNINYNKFYIIGKASYHIFLTQMLFFGFGGNIILKKFFYSYFFNYYKIFGTIFSLVICICFGICFYYIDNKIKLNKNTL